jgi:opine dehydrogenase
MKITILGTGNGGTTLAADLTLKGHVITLLKTSDRPSENFKYLLDNDGLINFKDLDQEHIVNIYKVTDSYEEAFSEDPELIIVFINTSYHEIVIKKMAPLLRDNQVVLLEPGYLSTAYFKKYCSDKELIIAEAESSPIDCRVIAPGKVKALFKNIRNPVGIYPMKRKDEGMAVLNQLGYNFKLLDSVAEAALHNPNLIVHTIGAIMSIPRIEYSEGDYWMYREVFTPSIWNLVKRLDKEKMNVLQELGLEPLSYEKACRFRNSEDLLVNAKEAFYDYALNDSPSGPTQSDSRYITEDVPQGLILLESMGKILKIKTPVCTSLIEIASACLDTDFREYGRTVKRLGRTILNDIMGKGKFKED